MIKQDVMTEILVQLHSEWAGQKANSAKRYSVITLHYFKEKVIHFNGEVNIVMSINITKSYFD